MCGILGVGGGMDAEVFDERLNELSHRGPDGREVWRSSELTLGHRRLAIIGTGAEGAQPMWSRSGESVIVFNGEIYNYLELADELEIEGRQSNRTSDTAVLLECLEAWEEQVLPRLNGMFAFAWYRPTKRSLLLARDRWGKKPLFWGRVGLGGARRQLAFSSELRTFTRFPGGPPAPDPLGILRYLVYDGLAGEHTVYRDVHKLAAGSWVELDPEGHELRRGKYWQPNPNPRRMDPEIAEELYLTELSRSIDLRLRSDVPVGLFLSGGMDSSTIASLWRRLRPSERIKTFTVGFEESSYDERLSARLVADAIGAEHHEIVATGADLESELDWVWDHLSEPFGDPSIVPTSLLCRFARQEVTVALGGDGADELQAGYDPFRAWTPSRFMETFLPRRWWHQSLQFLERRLPPNDGNLSTRFKVRHFAQGFAHPPEERVQAWMASFPVRLAAQVLRPELLAGVDLEEVLEPTRAAYRSARENGVLSAQIATWIRCYLESNILVKADRAGMMHSIEVRAPYLDPNLSEMLLGLPEGLIFSRGRGKVLMRRAASRILPGEVLLKPKKGFGVPQATWLRTVLRDRMEGALEWSRDDGWFAHEPIREMWDAHLARKTDCRKALWTFLFSFPFQVSG